jgi:hypothetical protein
MKMIKKMTAIIVTIGFLAGCSLPGQLITRDQFMERALMFDMEQLGKEDTPAYQECYGKFMFYLEYKCVPLVESESENLPYWTCANDALDVFEDCMKGKE